MRIYLVIGMVCSVLLVSSCSAPRPVPIDKPFRICAENETPDIDNCKKLGPTAPITIRGYRE